MENNNDEKNYFQKAQQGSGSAEARGESREVQKTKVDMSDEERKDIAQKTGLQTEDIISIRETGALSGRDDLSGGSGDGMISTSTDEPTDK